MVKIKTKNKISRKKYSRKSARKNRTKKGIRKYRWTQKGGSVKVAPTKTAPTKGGIPGVGPHNKTSGFGRVPGTVGKPTFFGLNQKGPSPSPSIQLMKNSSLGILTTKELELAQKAAHRRVSGASTTATAIASAASAASALPKVVPVGGIAETLATTPAITPAITPKDAQPAGVTADTLAEKLAATVAAKSASASASGAPNPLKGAELKAIFNKFSGNTTVVFPINKDTFKLPAPAGPISRPIQENPELKTFRTSLTSLANESQSEDESRRSSAGNSGISVKSTQKLNNTAIKNLATLSQTQSPDFQEKVRSIDNFESVKTLYHSLGKNDPNRKVVEKQAMELLFKNASPELQYIAKKEFTIDTTREYDDIIKNFNLANTPNQNSNENNKKINDLAIQLTLYYRIEHEKKNISKLLSETKIFTVLDQQMSQLIKLQAVIGKFIDPDTGKVTDEKAYKQALENAKQTIDKDKIAVNDDTIKQLENRYREYFNLKTHSNDKEYFKKLYQDITKAENDINAYKKLSAEEKQNFDDIFNFKSTQGTSGNQKIKELYDNFNEAKDNNRLDEFYHGIGIDINNPELKKLFVNKLNNEYETKILKTEYDKLMQSVFKTQETNNAAGRRELYLKTRAQADIKIKNLETQIRNLEEQIKSNLEEQIQSSKPNPLSGLMRRLSGAKSLQQQKAKLETNLQTYRTKMNAANSLYHINYNNIRTDVIKKTINNAKTQILSYLADIEAKQKYNSNENHKKSYTEDLKKKIKELVTMMANLEEIEPKKPVEQKPLAEILAGKQTSIAKDSFGKTLARRTSSAKAGPTTLTSSTSSTSSGPLANISEI
jgi:hypothetical protein